MLSVVVPARNSALWIGELIESIAVQGVSGLEIVLVDNGSVDGTAAIATGAAGAGASVRVVRSAALSAAAARNEGVAVARGEYLAFADADDLVPDGAYRSMLSSLEASGSDMVIGDHLKFAPARTWSPTERWWPFDRHITAARPVDVPQLLSGRACWNRMFRRSFWDDSGLSFPEVPSLEDVLPMTQAFVRARTIDVVPECVYLYRDRSGDASLSRRADLESTLRYFEQEQRCAEVTAGSDVLRHQHAEIILDADGWAHLDRFLRTEPSSAAVAEVAAAARSLLEGSAAARVDDVPAQRRVLWLLVLHGLFDAAVHFARTTFEAGAETRIGAWVRAVVDLAAVDPAAARALASEGLVPTFVNGADGLDTAAVQSAVHGLGRVDPRTDASELEHAMASAITTADGALVRRVSALRHVVPLVVSEVSATESGLAVSGKASLGVVGLHPTLVLDGPTHAETPVRTVSTSDGWSAEISASILPERGRHGTTVTFQGVEGSFPVVTARMPLPPLEDRFPLQPLADRRNGWRFLIDRRLPKRSVTGLAARLRARLGRVR